MVDLVTQHQKIQDELENAILSVVRSAAYIKGPEVKAFETELQDYLQAKHVIACANGTDALQVALMALNLPPDAEVIVPSFNYVATAEVIALLKLTPVFVDVDPATYNISPEAIRAAITPKTKVVMPVHLFGQCADMEPILAIAKEHNLYVIEDTAQAIGARYTFSDGRVAAAGTMGHIGTTSFFPSKNLGCMGDGGAIFSMDDDLAHAIRTIANHGQSKLYMFERVGVNSRLDSIQAAVLRVKLRYLDQYNQARQEAAQRYDALLAPHAEFVAPATAPYSTHVYHQYVLQIKKGSRDEVKAKMDSWGIPTMIYYPLPLNIQEAFAYLGQQQEGLFPISEAFCREVIALPMHTELSPEQQENIVNHLVKAVKG